MSQHTETETVGSLGPVASQFRPISEFQGSERPCVKTPGVAGKTAHWARVLVTEPDDLSFVPGLKRWDED